MAAANMPPRQKMINMMYLVLTAILALNVSKEVLDAFAVLDADLVRTGHAQVQRSRSEYARFDEAAAKFPDRFNANRAKALALRAEADSLVAYIDDIKAGVIAKAEGKTRAEVIGAGADGVDTLLALAYVEAKDDREVLTHELIGSEPAMPRDGAGSAQDLKRRLAAFRDRARALIDGRDEQLSASLGTVFALQGGKDASGTENNWECLNFYEVPLAAGIATLTKLQADVRGAENDLVKWLYRDAERGTHLITSLTAAVVPQSSVVMVGDSFRADVFLAAYDDKNHPLISLANGPVPLGADGKGKVRLKADAVGERTLDGEIAYQGPNGLEKFPYRLNYQVMAPLLVASPTKMNVLYKGVQNPVDLSVPGVTREQMRPVIDNGTITRSGDAWNVEVNSGSQANIRVQVAMPDGSVRTVGPVPFRVKDLPAPMAYVAGKSSRESRVKKTELTASQGLIARLEGSDFNEPFTVTSFTIVVLRASGPVPLPVTGNRFGDQARKLLEALHDGDRIAFEDIKAKLTNGQGRVYDLTPVVLKVVK
ncbi:MAG: gliding motility protein GldM [Flavobacteriales bacterium]